MSATLESEGMTPELLTVKQAAVLCGIGKRTLERYSCSGRAPRPVKIVGNVRYRRAELLAWIEAGCPAIDVPNPKSFPRHG